MRLQHLFFQGLAFHQFPEPLNLPLVVEKHHRPPSVRMPALQLADEFRPPRLLDHKVAGIKFAHRQIIAGRFRILHGQRRRVCPGSDPDRRLRPVFLQIHRDHHIAFADAFLQQHQPAVGSSPAVHFQQDAALLQLAYRHLTIRIKGAQAFHLPVEKFRPQRQLALPRIHIQDAAAHRELPALAHLGLPVITGLGELLHHQIQLHCLTRPQGEAGGRQTARRGHHFRQRRGIQQQHFEAFRRHRQPLQQRQSFGLRFQIRQRVFRAQFFGFREKCGGSPPRGQILRENLLRLQIPRQHPHPPRRDRLLQMMQHHARRKPLRRLRHLFQHDPFCLPLPRGGQAGQLLLKHRRRCRHGTPLPPRRDLIPGLRRLFILRRQHSHRS